MTNKINLVELLALKTNLECVDACYNMNFDVNQLELIYNSEMIAIIQFDKNLDPNNIVLEENSFKVFDYVKVMSENYYHYPTSSELLEVVNEIVRNYNNLYK